MTKRQFFFQTCLFAALCSGCESYHPLPLSPAETATRLDARSLSQPELKSFVETNLHQKFSQWPPAAWDLPTLTLVAFYFHPSLDVARAQWSLGQAETLTAKARPNPTVGLAPEYTANAASGMTPWIAGLNFDVPIETAGKRGYRMAKAKQLSLAARLNLAQTAWQVRKNLRDSLIDFADATQRQELLKKQLAVQTEIVKRFQQQLSAGAVSSGDVFATRIALTKSQAELGGTQSRVAEARVRIAESLGLPASALGEARFILNFSTKTVANSAEARRRALQSRTDILGALAEYAAAQSELQLQIAKQFPDVHLGPGYQYDQGANKWSLGINVELPLLDQNRGGIAEAKARRAEAAAKLIALQARISAEIDRATAGFSAAQEQTAHAESLQQLQTEQQRAAQSQFDAGEIDRLQLLAAQIEFQATQLLQLDAQTRAHKALADFEDAVQQPFENDPALIAEQNPRPEENKP